MGGMLDVETEMGKGSTFWRALEAVPAQGPGTDTRAPEAAGPPASATVLYIQDTAANVRLVERLLAARGVTLRAPGRGGSGSSWHGPTPPTPCSWTSATPISRGETALVRLKVDAATADISGVILTADATPRRAERLQAAGVAALLAEPLDVPRLLEVVDAHAPVANAAGTRPSHSE